MIRFPLILPPVGIGMQRLKIILAGLQGSGNKKDKTADIICIFSFAYFQGAVF